MEWPQKLIAHLVARARDGGTVKIVCRDERGNRHVISLQQSLFLRRSEPLAGRLMIDDCAPEPRSAEESKLIALLRSAEYDLDLRLMYPDGHPKRSEQKVQLAEDKSGEEDLQQSIARVIDWVESDEYVALAERIQRGEFTDEERGWINSRSH